jgi:hypothetical protein
VKEISQTVYNNGRPIGDVVLTTDGALFDITGKIDIITITDDGVANIYSIKSSKRDFDK